MPGIASGDELSQPWPGHDASGEVRVADVNHIHSEIMRRPFLPSRELASQLGKSREEIRRVYSVIRSSPEHQQAFGASPFHYLTKALGRLSHNQPRTRSLLLGEVPSPLAETLELFISSNCNVYCKFCYRRDEDYQGERIFSTDEFVNIINEFADDGGLNMDVSGGLEPLLSPSICQTLQTGVARNLRVNLYTIGNALHSLKLLEPLMAINQVRVSFSAHDRESYKQMMGVDQYDRVTTNLRMIARHKKERKAPVGLGMSFVVTRENYKHILDAMALARDLGMGFFDVRSVSVSPDDAFNDGEWNELRDILDEAIVRQGAGDFGEVQLSISDNFNGKVDPNGAFLKFVDPDLINSLVYYRVTVTPSGKVYPLNLLGQPSREDPQYLLGTLTSEARLRDILRNRPALNYDSELLLAHDISLLVALSKLKADLEFGIDLDENPFFPSP